MYQVTPEQAIIEVKKSDSVSISTTSFGVVSISKKEAIWAIENCEAEYVFLTKNHYGDNLKPHVILEYTSSPKMVDTYTFKLLNSDQEYYVKATDEEISEMNRKLMLGSHKGYVSHYEVKQVHENLTISCSEMMKILSYEPHTFEPVPELKN